MYAVKLQVSEKEASSSDAAQPSTSAQPVAASTYAKALTGKSESVEAVDVWAGNPRVEHLVGQVHLYRCTTDGRPGPSLDLPVCKARYATHSSSLSADVMHADRS